MELESKQIQPLLSLGLTDLEARIYIYLLSDNPATGYQIAKAVGKPAANTYEAIRSLLEKGALVVEEGKTRVCCAVPLKQFLSQLKRQFDSHLTQAESNLQERMPIIDEKRIYQIRNVEQVLERFRHILETAREIILIDAFPQILKPLKEQIQSAADRGIEVFVKSYKPVRIRGVKTVCDPRGSSLLSVYDGDWLRVVADGHNYLLAYFTNDCRTVGQAVWSANSFISLMEHFDLWTEIHMARLGRAIEAGAGLKSIHRVFSEHRRSRRERLSGYKAFVCCFAPEPEANRESVNRKKRGGGRPRKNRG
jgi:hypothetical protein